MKKIFKITVMSVLLAMATSLNAQIFIQPQKGDISPRNTSGTSEKEWIIVPVQGYDIDQYTYTPVGGGLVLLLGMAGGYVAVKRRKNKH